jgi:hypothetical protein
MAAPLFTPSRPQDAWGTIRGFVYQVDVTIARWLALRDDEALLLESGEDIDRVAEALASADDRLLEQIKVREGGVSLHNAFALDVLTKAVDHKQTNPGLVLRFRFTSTASVAREQGHPDPAQPPGIEVWERLRRGSPREKEDQELIQRLLGAVERPESVPETLWTNATAEFSDSGKLLALVRNFEWAMAAASPDDQSAQVLQALVRDGHAADEARAREVYEQLFEHVFRLLSHKGEKRLTRRALLAAAARPPAEDPAVTAFLHRVRERLASLGIRLSALDARVGRLEVQVATAFGLPQAAIAMGVPELDVEPPPLAAPVAPRTAVVAELIAIEAPWLAVVGDAGVGKSHLALMVAQAMGRKVIWVRLGQLSDAGAILVRTLSALSRAASLNPRAVVAAAGALITRENAVLVVDNLPSLAQDHPVGRVLATYLDLTAHRPLSLITSSVHPLPSVFASNTKRCVCRECPPFSDAEARELLEQYAGKAFLERSQKALAFLNAIAHGHPTLLKAMASYLRERDWKWDAAAFEGIFGGKYAESTHAETRAALAASISDNATRELLARLNLQAGEFGIEEIYAVASVSPEISRPVERARDVEGTWLQRVRTTRFRLSPLLLALPPDLPSQVAKDCRLSLARERMKRPLDQDSGASVVGLLTAGGAHDMAGLILTDLLLTLAHDVREIDPGLLLDLWSNAPLPPEMSSAVRILVRHAQVVAGQRYNKPARVAAREFDELIGHAGDDDQWAVASVETQRFMGSFEAEPERAADSLDRALAASTKASLPDGSRYPMPDPAPLVWVQVIHLATPRHLRAWLRLVAHLPAEARTWDDGDGGRAATACIMACDRVWLPEIQKSEADRRWGEVHEALDEVRSAARAIQFAYLEACAVRAKMTVLSEYNGRPEEAIALADASVSEHHDDKACVALIEEGLGRLHFYANAPAEALEHLRRALEHGASLGSLGPLTANYASRAAAKAEPGAAAELARTTVELATAEAPDPTGPSAIAVIQAKGELAIALWNAGDKRGCAQALLDAGEHLQANINDPRVTRKVGVGFFQVTVRLAGNLTERRLPEEHLRVPSPGFLFENPGGGRAVEWRSDFPVTLAFEMCQLAGYVDDETRARRWAGIALDCGDEGAEHGLSASLQLQLLSYLLLSERDDAMVTVATRLCGILRADRRATDESRMDLEEHPMLPMLAGVLPLALALGSMAVSERSKAQALSEECATVLSEAATDSTIGDILRDAGDLLSAPYKGGSYKDIGSPNDRPESVQDIAMLQGSLFEDFPLETACKVHLKVLSQAWKHLRGGTHRLVERFLDRFWTSAFHRRRFQFRNPREVERTINELTTQPLSVRSRRLLEAIADDLRIKMPPELRDWCRAA